MSLTLSYLPRLLCLCFSIFFLLNAASTLLVRTFSRAALKFAETRRSNRAADFLLVVRLLPFALATLFVLVLCVPSYLRLEPAETAESVGLPCLVLGAIGLVTWALAILRAVRAAAASGLYCHRIAKVADRIYLREQRCSVLVVDTSLPLLALGGLFGPRLLISRELLQSLSPDELDAALAHEQAHKGSSDNLKRLLLLLAPDVFPFLNPLGTLEQSWCRFTEWAADDDAAAGSSQRGVSLAAALLRAAQLGAAPVLPYIATSLLARDFDLSVRVERLLRPASAAAVCDSRRGRRVLSSAFLIAGSLALVLLAPLALPPVHELLELFLR